MLRLVIGLCFALAMTASAAFAENYFRNGQPITEAQFKASNLNTEALNLIRANANEKAIELLNEVIKLEPGLPPAHHNLGLAYSKIGNMQKAIEELKLAVNLDPQASMSWLVLGGVYQSGGRLDEALQVYQEMLKQFPDFPDRAQVKGLVGKLKEELARQKEAGSTDDDSYFRQVTSGHPVRWCASSQPVKVFISDGQGVPSFRSEFIDIAKGSFVDWANVAQGQIKIVFVSDPRLSGIKVIWTDNPKELANPAECGFTSYSYNGHCLAEGTIKLLTVPINRSEEISTRQLRKACMHEVGHILGLTGHSPNPADVMFYSLPTADDWLVPSSRDAATIVRLYSEPNLDLSK